MTQETNKGQALLPDLEGMLTLATEARELRKNLARAREEALRENGLGDWLKTMQEQIGWGILPEVTKTEGQLVAETFRPLKGRLEKWKLTPPEKKTETPIVEAVETDLWNLFGEGFDTAINEAVGKLASLRRKKPKNNKYLRIAVLYTLMDIVNVARFHFEDGEDKEANWAKMREASRKALGFNLFGRLIKGVLRKEELAGLTSLGKQKIYAVRGLRDLPPGSGQTIGEMVEGLIGKSR